MQSPTKSFILQDLEEKYDVEPASPKYKRLYIDDPLGHMCAVLHEKLNEHFTAINGRAETTRHYWAEPSRELIDLIKQLRHDLHNLNRANVPLKLARSYEDAIELCSPWLSQSGGSTVPDDFQKINVIHYEKVFLRDVADQEQVKRLNDESITVPRQLVGEGAYALVYKYIDPNYDTKFAVKKARKNIDDRDLLRFRKEFKIMSELDFPYVLQVYKYDDIRNEYSMEYCDETLRKFVERRNSRLDFSTRKRIALQFLYGINYLHRKGILHRDISLQNILVKVFDLDSVIIKLSDFGLAKEESSEFTRTETEIRGTIVDPYLEDFKSYNVVNEMFAIGSVLSFIFSGKNSLQSDLLDIGPIIRKCTGDDLQARYQTVASLIMDIEKLPF